MPARRAVDVEKNRSCRLMTRSELVRLLSKPPLHVQLRYIKFRLAAWDTDPYLRLRKRYPESARNPGFAGLVKQLDVRVIDLRAFEPAFAWQGSQTPPSSLLPEA